MPKLRLAPLQSFAHQSHYIKKTAAVKTTAASYFSEFPARKLRNHVVSAKTQLHAKLKSPARNRLELAYAGKSVSLYDFKTFLNILYLKDNDCRVVSFLKRRIQILDVYAVRLEK